MKKYIPSIITLLNLTCGFIAIILNDILWSPLLILAGGLFDLLDGMMAKLLNAISDLGKQLDSLADLITFGVAPAFLFYQHILPHDYLSMISASLLPAFGAFRLAKFNIDTEQTSNFKGLPIPANGIFFLSFPFLINFDSYEWFFKILQVDYVALLFPPVFAILMISNIKMFSFKKFKGIFGIQTIYILAVLLIAIFLHWLVIPLAIITYIVFSVFWNFTIKE